jgi:VTC domain
MSTGRFELKYPVGIEQAAAARTWARAFCSSDPFGDQGRYVVSSLYLDTRDERLVYHTLQGNAERFKLRIRCYSFDECAPMFPEIKRRAGRAVLKERARATRAGIRGLLAGDPSGLEPSTAAMAFRLHMDELDLRPRVWVRYIRDAWTSPFGDGARLTVDWGIEAQVPPEGDPLSPLPDGWVPIPTERPQLVELKFDGAFPGWMDRLVRAADLRRTSFSKYTRAALATAGARETGFGWTP